ncbi:MAG: hypothetical protein P1U39_00325 [Legionellaceae bacterium]|nr:hypothetical protein [Legionellaceae bacterium]
MGYEYRYFIEYAPESWGFADIKVNDGGEIESIQINNTSIDIQQPCIYLAYDNESQKVFWLGMSSKSHVYRFDYNLHTQNVEKAELLFPSPSKYVAIPNEIKQLPKFPVSKQAPDVLEYMKAEGAYHYTEHQRSPDELLTLDKIEALSIRPADATERMQLMGAQDDMKDKSLAYQKQCEAEYTAQVQGELEALVVSHLNDYAGLKAALKAYLSAHWQKIKSNSLSYLALPDSSVTQLLLNVAQRLGRFENKSAISYLMPDVHTQHVTDESLHLENLDLTWVLKTHVLNETGHYLLPVELLLEHARLADEEQSPWMSSTGLMYNPYCDPEHATESSHVHVSLGDLRHMYQHAALTQQLRDVYRRYETVKSDAPSLLGQLNTLLPVLKRSDAHGGLGRQTDVHASAYPAIMRFMAYYRRLHPIGLVVAENAIPTSDELFKEGDTSTLRYALVKSGEDAGLYCVSRYNADGSLRTAEEARANKIVLCNTDTPARYALNVMVVEQFEDTAELRNNLGNEHPSLIRVQSGAQGQHHTYGRQADGNWGFTTIQTDATIRLPEDSNGNVILNRKVAHPLGNVPTKIYQAINSQSAHHEQKRMLANLTGYFSESAQICNLEQLAFIQAQTGHLDLDEFTDVPETVRDPIRDLWQFIQNPSVNITVDTIQTCVGMLRERLEPAVREHADALNTIQWSAAERRAEFEAAGHDVVQTRETLAKVLKDGTYQGGRDVRPPTHAMLKALDKQLTLSGPLDFKWFCHFQPESISAFLSDPDNPSPLRYLQDNYKRVEDLSILLIEIPPSAFNPILAHLNIALTVQELGQLNQFIGNDRVQAFLDAIKDKLPEIIKNVPELGYALRYLSEGQCDVVLEAIKDKLPEIIKNAPELGYALRYLSEGQCRAVLDAIKDKLPEIIKDGHQLGASLEPLSEWQRGVVLDAIKDKLPEIIKSGFLLGASLEPLSEGQCRAVLNAIQDKLPEIIKDGYQLRDALRPLSEGQRGVVLDAIQDKLPEIIKDGHQLGASLEPLSEWQRGVVLDAIKDKLPEIIKSGFLLGASLEPLSEGQCRAVLNAIQDKLPEIIKDGYQLRDALRPLSEGQRGVVLDAIQDKLPEIIKDGHQLGASLEPLSEGQRGVVLDAIQGQLPQIIKSGYQLADALQHLSEGQRDVMLRSIKGQLPEIIKSGPQLRAALETLSMGKRGAVPDAIQGQLPEIIKDGDQLVYALQYLSEGQRDVVLRSIKGQLPEIIKSGSQLREALQYLSEDQCRAVLDAIQGKLPEIIKDGSELESVLRCLNQYQRGFVLHSIKGKLHRLNKDVLSTSYQNEINLCLKNSQHGFFSTPRAEAINTGSLSSKLGKYIESRRSEHSFHWDFLGIMAFVHWLSGEPWVKAKDTKLAAATYALHAHQDEDACLVRLTQLNELPNEAALKELHKNSYLLVGQNNAPKQLYYVDYEGNTTKIPMADAGDVQSYFSQEGQNKQLTYSELGKGLRQHTQSPLPTDVQLEALKEGLLGDIMIDAGVDDILDGTKRPTEPKDQNDELGL